MPVRPTDPSWPAAPSYQYRSVIICHAPYLLAPRMFPGPRFRLRLLV